MSGLIQGFRVLFRKHPLVANSVIYGSLYVTAELSQQTFNKKILVSTNTLYV